MKKLVLLTLMLCLVICATVSCKNSQSDDNGKTDEQTLLNDDMGSAVTNDIDGGTVAEDTTNVTGFEVPTP